MLLDAVKKMRDIVEIQDSRDPKKVRYPLGPTLFAIILAWMCGYNSALQVEYFWRYKFKILRVKGCSLCVNSNPKFDNEHK